jgi:hypothetical protein
MIYLGPPPRDDIFWSLPQLADIFERPVYDLRVLVYFGDLPGVLIGDEVYIRDSDLVAFINEHFGDKQ